MTQTDPTGQCFISYRRSRAEEVERIVQTMLDLGVPPWQDRRNLGAEPLADGLSNGLDASTTSSGLIWVSRDVAGSPVILGKEAPTLLRRARLDPGFHTVIWMTDGLAHSEASGILTMPGEVEDVSASWNIERAAVDAAGRIDDPEAFRIASALLHERLRRVHLSQPEDRPLRVLLNAFGDEPETFLPGFAARLQWARHLSGRHAPSATWTSRLVPALKSFSRAVREHLPGRTLIVEGRATLSACLALGRACRETTGVRLGWRQHPSGQVWMAGGEFVAAPVEVLPLKEQHHDSTELALLVSLASDVEPAVSRTPGSPRWRAVLAIRPAGDAARVELNSPAQANGAVDAIVEAWRKTRQRLRNITRTHLFLSGPAGLAVLLGQRLNALGPVQMYELEQPVGGERFRPSVLLCDDPA